MVTHNGGFSCTDRQAVSDFERYEGGRPVACPSLGQRCRTHTWAWAYLAVRQVVPLVVVVVVAAPERESGSARRATRQLVPGLTCVGSVVSGVTSELEVP